MGFGMITIPRVGQEVLVGFLEGDPDQPVVMGRLFNGTARPPYDLPQHKSRSGWRSDSTPGSGGYNEIMFEDAKGRELVYLQAERDHDTVVKRNESRSIGNDRQTQVGAVDASLIGARYNVTMKEAESKENKVGPTLFEMVDGRIVFSTGEASITLDGPNITLEAKGRIFVHSTDDDVEILGGPWVKINCGPVPEGESDTVTMHHITGVVRDQDEEPLKGQTVVVKASDGSVQQVQTDGTGRYFALVPPGRCQVSLPGGMRYGTQGGNLDTMNEEAEEFEDGGEVV
jgi:type VI secretion system secreted protein VgrG